MKKYVYSFCIILLIIITSITFLGNVDKDDINNYSIRLVDSSSFLVNNNIRNIEDFQFNKSIDEIISVHKSIDSIKKLKNQLFEKSFEFLNISNLNGLPNNLRRKKIKYNFVDKYRNVLSCNLLNYSRFTIEDLQNNYEQINFNSKNYDYSQQVPQEFYKIRVVRALLVYFPIEMNKDYILEFKWLYRSWLEMQKNEPSKWRTDIVVFINNDQKIFKEDFFLNKLNCSFENKRTSNLDEPMCTLISYIPLKKRELIPTKIKEFNSTQKYHYLLNNVDIFSDDEFNLAPFYEFLKEQLSNYGYLDSILMAFDGYNYLKSAGYNFVIRSDMDVFLTPLFGKWLPRNCNDFYVGRGGFSSPFNMNRLNRIARELNFFSASQENLGSTWYSTVDQFRLVSYLTMFSMSFLSNEEFTPPEKLGQLGVMLWPYWHYGVLLLYGQSLAMNHLIGSHQLNIIKIHDHLDYPSYYDNEINKMIHIHVFHGDDMFSKFQFKLGKYDNLNPDEHNVSLTKYYALKMALEGKRISENGLTKMLNYEITKKN